MSESAAVETVQETAAPANDAAPKSDIELWNELAAAEDAKEAGQPANDAAPKKPAKPPEKKPEAEDETRVSLTERDKWRAEKRDWRQRISSKEQALAAKEAEIAAKLEAAASTSPERIRALIEGSDFDGFAKLIGFKGWADLNDTAIRAYASPEFRHTRKLEQELQALKAQKEEESRKAAEQAEVAQRETAKREYQAHLATTLKGSPDAGIREAATDPEEGEAFRQAVYGKIANHYQETGDELDPDEAAEEIVREVILPRLARWNRIFGTQSAVTTEAAQAASANRAAVTKTPVRSSKHVSRHAAKQASTQAPPNMSDAEAIRYWAKQMEESSLEDDEDAA
jgi:hypothetical protein